MSASMGNYNTVGGAIKTMFRDEGVRGFYKGLYPNLLKVSSISSPIFRSLLLLCFCFILSSWLISRRSLRVWRQVGSRSSLFEIYYRNCSMHGGWTKGCDC